MNGAPDVGELNRKLLELAKDPPELVVVDARVLRLLLGPLADLVIRGGRVQSDRMASAPVGWFNRTDPDAYVWDEDDLCP